MNKITKMQVKDDSDRINFSRLINKIKDEKIIDEIEQQLEELFFIRHPAKKPDQITKQEIFSYSKQILKGEEIKYFGTWVYYPWNGYLVHFLPEKLHTELRTARNRNLITKEEQDKFYNAKVGISGLSVGNSVAATLLHSGGPKFMRLADFDTLAASNTNRIRSGFINLGLKKIEIVVREIYEVNPYANLLLFPKGLSLDSIENFLLFPKPLDVLVDEMDNIYLKIKIRLLARKYKIPVVMAADNGDGVVLDIERYDLDGNYPLFHGDVPEDELMKVTPDFPKFEAARIITRWVHPENVAYGMQKSLLELGKTLYTWPQLGTAAFMAGCCVSYAVRNIINGEPIKSGKYIISLENKILYQSYSKTEQIKRKKHTQIFKQSLKLS